jgi:predicted NACHT family NTPase
VKKGHGSSFHFESDERLPVLVTLRRYADALKTDDNLSLVDYILENIAADFTITGLTSEFLEYYLESGQTILLFDGLDELPNPSFKKKIRNRIRTLTGTYPGNSMVVTSRIYGYEGVIRFDKNKFNHHRLAKLCMEEIEQFVRDWYHARLEKPRDRRDYLDSLLGILCNEENEAIRELARNPLLLTIIVLVHRIDAVLPDERHVLYQKCTETLLNTWHTSKFHEMDRLHRAKVDRLNMQRMQAVAYWMHHQMGGSSAKQQAVVSYRELNDYLIQHIKTEMPPHPDFAPEDIATAFIDFVQDRAGLLVEIGDKKFSFVHLTFQEYLTAVHIRTLSELNGVKGAWSKEIDDHCSDPRWREVIRLLVAGLGSNEVRNFWSIAFLTLTLQTRRMLNFLVD